MSHLDPQTEDSKDILAAKAIVRGEAAACESEMVRLMKVCLDDRSNLIQMAGDAMDTMINASVTFERYSHNQDELKELQSLREMYREIAKKLRTEGFE